MNGEHYSISREAGRCGILSGILQRILTDPRYQEGVTYGKPRKGHDEGTVANHIAELERSLGQLSAVVSAEEKLKLLIIIHVHDTFKLEGKRQSHDRQVSLRDPRSHPMMARAFLAEFITDDAMLAIVQWHDEGHALWKQVETKGVFSTIRLDEALRHIPDLELFLIFTVLDGWTESKLKDRTPKWFLDVVTNYVKPEKPFRAYTALECLEAYRCNSVTVT